MLKVQHIKDIANILADSVSRLKAVELYHDLDFQNSQLKLGTTFEPSSPVKHATHTPIEVHENFIKLNIETLAQNHTVAQIDQCKLSLRGMHPQKMSLI